MLARFFALCLLLIVALVSGAPQVGLGLGTPVGGANANVGAGQPVGAGIGSNVGGVPANANLGVGR